ncbi:hypothetical protein C8R45DRAFT_945417 [Mycena sanguinolenta]|nr:hypothetical protein C8R45DRAFT_945417 [Mycena sanguinolenta]
MSGPPTTSQKPLLLHGIAPHLFQSRRASTSSSPRHRMTVLEDKDLAFNHSVNQTDPAHDRDVSDGSARVTIAVLSRAELEAELTALKQKHAIGQAENRALTAERDAARVERDAAMAERDAAREVADARRDAADARRDAADARRDAAEAEAKLALAQSKPSHTPTPTPPLSKSKFRRLFGKATKMFTPDTVASHGLFLFFWPLISVFLKVDTHAAKLRRMHDPHCGVRNEHPAQKTRLPAAGEWRFIRRCAYGRAYHCELEAERQALDVRQRKQPSMTGAWQMKHRNARRGKLEL